VSVIVPVWNDAKRLNECLGALDAQTYPSFEVVVIDNGSARPVGDVIARHSRARLVHEARPGSYAARNAGMAHARGEVFAFTDADCIPGPEWIEKGQARLAQGGERSIVAGRIEIFPRVRMRANAVEQYEGLFALAQCEFVRRYKFGATANLFAPREAFDRAGPFLAELKSGGDLEWGRRAAAFGYVVEYAEEVCIRHPARFSILQLYSKIVRVTDGLHDLKRIKGRGYVEFYRGFWAELLPPIRAITRTLREPSLRLRRDRLKVCAVVMFVRYVGALENARLRFPKLWKRQTTAR
jgi:glycosyltransferase involved in cell wall biosynthesis